MRHHARFVGIGIERPEYVDKDKTFGHAYADATLSAELAGIPPGHSCEPCGVTLAVDVETLRWTVRTSHERSQRHRRLAGQGPA